MHEEPGPSAGPQLVRALGTGDGAVVTLGAIVGTGIFIATSDIARILPHPGFILLAWVLGGLLSLAGALSYAELGAMFPRAGGQYHYLKEAFGPLWGFLFGWSSFLIIATGGVAALAVGFGEYLGALFPFLSSSGHLVDLSVGSMSWSVRPSQLTAAVAIGALSTINYFGLTKGAWVQKLLTVVTAAALVALAVAGLFFAPAAPPAAAPAAPAMGWLSGFGLAMVATLWCYDGWYSLTFSAGEVRDPARNLPWGLLLGTGAATLLYAAVNGAYLRVLPLTELGSASRVGELAASAIFGAAGGRLASAAIALATLGCLSATILCYSRVYLPMAQDGLFPAALAQIHPRYRTPGASIAAQAGWSTLLVFSGSYDELYSYVMFTAILFHALTGVALFVLRFRRPEAPRPYRAWGYPVLPALFVAASLLLVVNALVERPLSSLAGLLLVASGLPAYGFWRSRAPRAPRTEALAPERP